MAPQLVGQQTLLRHRRPCFRNSKAAQLVVNEASITMFTRSVFMACLCVSTGASNFATSVLSTACLSHRVSFAGSQSFPAVVRSQGAPWRLPPRAVFVLLIYCSCWFVGRCGCCRAGFCRNFLAHPPLIVHFRRASRSTRNVRQHGVCAFAFG